MGIWGAKPWPGPLSVNQLYLYYPLSYNLTDHIPSIAEYINHWEVLLPHCIIWLITFHKLQGPAQGLRGLFPRSMASQQSNSFHPLQQIEIQSPLDLFSALLLAQSKRIRRRFWKGARHDRYNSLGRTRNQLRWPLPPILVLLHAIITNKSPLSLFPSKMGMDGHFSPPMKNRSERFTCFY